MGEECQVKKCPHFVWQYQPDKQLRRVTGHFRATGNRPVEELPLLALEKSHQPVPPRHLVYIT